MKNSIITFNDDGTASCIHTDAIPLDTLGTLTVRRASTVEYNNLLQRWEVRWAGDDDVSYHNPSRAACLAWEVEQLQSGAAPGMSCPLPIVEPAPLNHIQHHAYPGGRWNLQ